ncbi:MAG TPA: hypothetical protein VG815_08985 [Chloroflexota bacterium]|nr:hypothetical protein [Chloroflexota bacterium]
MVKDSGPDDRPWSPLVLTILSLFFGLGAIVVSIRNLERMGVLDARLARFYLWGTICFLASIVLLIWSLNPHAFDTSPAQQVAPLSFGCPIAVVLIQIGAYHRWRISNPDIGTRPWFTALLPVLGMTVITAMIAVVAIEIFSAVFGTK